MLPFREAVLSEIAAVADGRQNIAVPRTETGRGFLKRKSRQVRCAEEGTELASAQHQSNLPRTTT
jgi:hypothetical protein